jgi:hypothetical protein
MSKNPYFDEDGLDDSNDSGSFDEPVSRPPVTPALPEWAQITADLPTDDQPAPPKRPNRPGNTSAAPAAPQVTGGVPGAAPQAVPGVTPAAAPERVAVPAPVAPAVPAPEPVVPEPVEVAKPAPKAAPTITPAPAKKPAPKPAPAPTKKQASPMVIDFDQAARSPIVAAEPMAPVTPTTKLGKFAGGRWKVVALRSVVWFALSLVILSGIKTMITPAGANIPKITSAVLTQIGRNNFPMEVGQETAARFAQAYASYDPTNESARRAELAQYMTTGGQNDPTIVGILGGTDAMSGQSVVSGPFLAFTPELVDDTHVVYTFGLQVKSAAKGSAPHWIYLAVPMVADDKGAVAVAGSPALVPGPAIAPKGSSLSFKPDDTLATSAKSALEQYFPLWAKSDRGALVPYLQDGVSTSAASAGLSNSVQYKSMSTLAVEKFDKGTDTTGSCTGPDYAAPCRKGDVVITWTSNGVDFRQEYRLILFQDGQYWRVIDIRGGSFQTVQ